MNVHMYRGCSIASRLCNQYPERVQALACLAAGYLPPSPDFILADVLAITKQAFGYELFGYWLFFSENGADKIIESHVCPLSCSAYT